MTICKADEHLESIMSRNIKNFQISQSSPNSFSGYFLTLVFVSCSFKFNVRKKDGCFYSIRFTFVLIKTLEEKLQ